MGRSKHPSHLLRSIVPLPGIVPSPLGPSVPAPDHRPSPSRRRTWPNSGMPVPWPSFDPPGTLAFERLKFPFCDSEVGVGVGEKGTGLEERGQWKCRGLAHRDPARAAPCLLCGPGLVNCLGASAFRLIREGGVA